MSVETEGSQTEAQASQLELEYHREEKHENKSMDATLVEPKFNPNLIVRAYDDNLPNGSSKSGRVDHYLPAALFFVHASARVATQKCECGTLKGSGQPGVREERESSIFYSSLLPSKRRGSKQNLCPKNFD
jgi:hypothetical protein